MKRIVQELEEFGLQNASVLQLSVPSLNSPAYAIKVNKANRYELWDHFRNLKASLGLYPVVTATWGAASASWEDCIRNEDFFMRFPFENDSPGLNVAPNAILQRAQQSDFRGILEDHNESYSEDLVDQIEYNIEHIQRQYDKAPFEQNILSAMSAQKIQNYYDLHRWLFHWQMQEVGEARLKQGDTSFLDWYDPQGQVEAMLLLPIDNGYDALAYMHWYGAEGITTERVIAMLRYWQENFGAELVAHYGTMLHMTCKTLPNMHQAFQLAMEQEALAPCTTVLPGATLTDLAAALTTRFNWFLHERP